MIGLSFPLFPRVLSAFKYRDRMAIIGDILRSLRSPNGRKKKTQIMQSANLNCMQFDKYLRYLLRYGFLKVTEKGEIQMTDEGAKFLLFLETKQIPTIV